MRPILSEDVFGAQYTAAKVSAVTGASATALQNWANRGLIKPTRSASGKGTRRLYSKVEVLTILAARELMDSGVEASTAFSLGSLCIASLLHDISVREYAEEDERSFSAAVMFINEKGKWQAEFCDSGEEDIGYAIGESGMTMIFVLRFDRIREAISKIDAEPKARKRKAAKRAKDLPSKKRAKR